MSSNLTGAGVLELQHYGLAMEGRVLLAGVDLKVPARGVTVLTGPAGGGKSVLLRGVAVLSRDIGKLQHTGRARFQGVPLGPKHRPFMAFPKPPAVPLTVEQFLLRCMQARQPGQRPELDLALQTLARHGCGDLISLRRATLSELDLVQFRRLGIVTGVVLDEPLLLLDDPTAGVPRAGAIAILSLMSQVAKDRAILAVIRQIEHIRAIGQQVVLMAEGHVCAAEPVSTFFRPPADSLVAIFLRTGQFQPRPSAEAGEAPPAVAQAARHVEPLAAPTDWGDVTSAESAEDDDSRLSGLNEVPPPAPEPGPRVTWLESDRLAVCAWPAGASASEAMLQGLRRLGITAVLSASVALPAEATERLGLLDLERDDATQSSHGGLSWPQRVSRVSASLRRGDVLALLGPADSGALSTLAAGHLVHQGASVAHALQQLQRLQVGRPPSADEEWQLLKLEAAMKLRPASPA